MKQEAGKSVRRQVSDDAVIAQPPVFMEQLKEVGVVAEGQNIFLEARWQSNKNFFYSLMTFRPKKKLQHSPLASFHSLV
jgi:hypothetical protein